MKTTTTTVVDFTFFLVTLDRCRRCRRHRRFQVVQHQPFVVYNLEPSF
jgi:hypothetical protein